MAQKNYEGVREIYKYVIALCSIVSVIAFIGFEFFLGQIMLLFVTKELKNMSRANEEE